MSRPDSQNPAAILYALQGLRNLKARGFYRGPIEGLVDPTAVYRAASQHAAQQGAFQPLPSFTPGGDAGGGGLPALPAVVQPDARAALLAAILRFAPAAVHPAIPQ